MTAVARARNNRNWGQTKNRLGEREREWRRDAGECAALQLIFKAERLEKELQKKHEAKYEAVIGTDTATANKKLLKISPPEYENSPQKFFTMDSDNKM